MSASDTHVCFAKIDEAYHQRLLHTHLKRFPQVMQFRRWQDAQLYLLGRLLAEMGIKKLTGVGETDILYNAYGKPYLNGNAIFFNISHSANIVVCAFSDSEIGIDIEKLDSSIQPAEFKDQMTEGEWTTIVNSPNTIYSFYKYWTEKEAVIKQCGKGLSILLRSFEVTDNSTQIDNEIIYTRQLFIEDGYLCSIAGRNLDQIIITGFHHTIT